MPRNGSGTSPCSLFSEGLSFRFDAMTGSTVAPALGRDTGIFGRVFMAFFAMCLRVCSALVRCNHFFQLFRGKGNELSVADHLFVSAATLDPADDSIGFVSRYFRKRNGKMLDPINENVFGVSTVSLLFFPCSPSAIFRRVISVIVYALKRIPMRALTHISNECRVTVYPLRADFNAPTPVGRIRFIRGRVTAALHALPSSIVGRRSFERHILST